jgi:2,4-dienoyl-CoA reductase-like NADH-dependent reductase (Old Yellow Enzyme family)
MASLAEPLRLPCGVVIKNRIAKTAMTEGLADPLNRATSRHVTLYKRWAEGGAGILLTGNVQVDRRYLERPGNVAIDGAQSDEQKALLSRWAKSATENGAAIWMQIAHAGRQTPRSVCAQPVAPSAVPLRIPGNEFAPPRALTAHEIEEVITRFAHAASVAKSTGFTGVQVHGAHGYLISEFLNPIANKRDDQWGGSLKNRARLLLKTVSATRAAVGSGFPVSVKLNSSDFQKGGFSFDECLEVVEWLNESGIDLLEISGGSYEQPSMMDMDGLEPRHEERLRESTQRREAYFLKYAEEVRRVARMPMMVTGGFRSRAAMDEALQTRAADVIGIGRPLCVDPAIPSKLLSGAIAAAPSYEKTLRLGPGFFGPNSPNDIIKAVNGFGAMAFFYENLFRLADGLDAKEKMPFLSSFIRFRSGELKTAKALTGRAAIAPTATRDASARTH